AGVAGFFIQENGVFHTEASYMEFPFRRRDLGGGASANERPERGTERPERGTATPERRDVPAPAAAPTRLIPPVIPTLNPVVAPEPRADNGSLQTRPIETPPIFANFDEPASPWPKRIAWTAFAIALIVFGLVVGNQFNPAISLNHSGAATGDAYSLN